MLYRLSPVHLIICWFLRFKIIAFVVHDHQPPQDTATKWQEPVTFHPVEQLGVQFLWKLQLCFATKLCCSILKDLLPNVEETPHSWTWNCWQTFCKLTVLLPVEIDLILHRAGKHTENNINDKMLTRLQFSDSHTILAPCWGFSWVSVGDLNVEETIPFQVPCWFDSYLLSLWTMGLCRDNKTESISA